MTGSGPADGMLVTTWDGHLRLDRVGVGAVLLTLLTVEPVTEAGLRSGLTAAFVTDDPEGPPARVRAVLDGDRLPGDVADLVGPRISEAVTVLGGGAWLRLNLAEVDDLAEAWAPYRRRVLAGCPAEPVTGSWAGGLWTVLDLDWGVLTDGPRPAPVFRGDVGPRDPDDAGAVGSWPVPGELAAACGCDTTLTWRAVPAPDDTVALDLAVPGGDGPDELLAGPDLPGAQWTPLRPDGRGHLRGRITVPGPGTPAVRLRTRNGGTP